MSLRRTLALMVAITPLLIGMYVLGGFVPALLGFGSGTFVAMVAVTPTTTHEPQTGAPAQPRTSGGGR